MNEKSVKQPAYAIQATDLVDGSVFLKHFYPGNWFFGWIRSIL